MPDILETHGLTKRYGEHPAVTDLSFSIGEGEIFSLLGPNGAGKTTTISMLSTLIAPSGGDATIAGHSITRDPQAVRRAIGVVPQEIALYDDLTAHENLIFWGQMQGLSGARLRQRIEAVLAQIGLADRAGQRVKTYSGGMKRRVNIGVGLLHEPRLLFMDEPTVGIDPQSRRAILDTVKDLNRQGMTVLYTTHYMEEAAELSHRIGIVDHGRMIALGTLDALTRAHGEGESLRLRVGDDQNGPALAEAIGRLPGALGAASSDGEVTALVTSASDILPAVIAAASAAGIRIRNIDIQEPNLEAVFLRLTGRALRD